MQKNNDIKDSTIKRSASHDADQGRASGQANPTTRTEVSPPKKTTTSVDPDIDEVGNSRELKSHQGLDRITEMEIPKDSREFTETREFTDEEYLRRLREEDGGVLLPRLPKTEGWHLLWASRDLSSPSSWRRYINLGYSFASPADIPGFIYETVPEGELAGKICHKELVLMKQSEARHQMAMKHFHHDQPLAMERGIVDDVTDKIVHKDKSLLTDVGEGIEKLGRAAPLKKRFE